jgi:hypothetical protein
LQNCWVQISAQPEVPTTSHLDKNVFGFYFVFKQVLRWFTISQLLLRASHAHPSPFLNSSKLSPIAVKAAKIISNYTSDINSGNQNSGTSISSHPFKPS